MYKPTPKNYPPKNDSAQQGSKTIPLINLVDDFFALIQSNETNDQNYTVGKDDPVAYEKFADNLIASWEKLEKKVGKEVSQEQIMELKTAQWKTIEKKFFQNTYSFLSDDPEVLFKQVMAALQKIAPNLESNVILKLEDKATLAVLKNVAVMEERWINLEAKINQTVSLEDAINWNESATFIPIDQFLKQDLSNITFDHADIIAAFNPSHNDVVQDFAATTEVNNVEQFTQEVVVENKAPLSNDTIDLTVMSTKESNSSLLLVTENLLKDEPISTVVHDPVINNLLQTNESITNPNIDSVEKLALSPEETQEAMMALLLAAYCLNCQQLQDNSEKSIAKISELNKEWHTLETKLGKTFTKEDIFQWEKDEDIKVANTQLCQHDEIKAEPETTAKPAKKEKVVKEPKAIVEKPVKKTAKAKKEAEAVVEPVDNTPKKIMGFMLRRK